MDFLNELVTIIVFIASTLNFVSCTTESEGDPGTGSLKINGVVYESRGYVSALRDETWFSTETTGGHEIDFIIYSPIADLNTGSEYASFSVKYDDEYYDRKQGEIIIVQKGVSSITIQIKDLIIKNKSYNGNIIQRKIEGTVTLYNSMVDENSNPLPF